MESRSDILVYTGEPLKEGIEVSGPEPAKRSQPGIHFLKWFWLQAVETALGIHGGLHETGLAQHPQVL